MNLSKIKKRIVKLQILTKIIYNLMTSKKDKQKKVKTIFFFVLRSHEGKLSRRYLTFCRVFFIYLLEKTNYFARDKTQTNLSRSSFFQAQVKLIYYFISRKYFLRTCMFYHFRHQSYFLMNLESRYLFR